MKIKSQINLVFSTKTIMYITSNAHITGWPAAGKTWKILENPGKWKGVLENLENDSFWSKILEKQGFLKTVLEFFQ